MRIEAGGFFDLQVNGFSGVDFNTPGNTADNLAQATNAIRKCGVTRFLPTLISSTLQRFSECARALLTLDDPAIVGIHMEGPYISGSDGARGAHLREYVRSASIEDFERRQEAADGRIILVTLAPEVPGAFHLIEYLRKRDIRVAIGHTTASPGLIRNAVSAGATLSTHLGNGCLPVLYRHPNLIWEQLANDNLLASLIVDGQHLPAATVKTMVRAKTPSRIILITDATAAAGSPPGPYRFGEMDIKSLSDGRVSQPGSQYLAGSALSMASAISNVVRFTGLPLEDVIRMASVQPAEYLGHQVSGRVVAIWDDRDCHLYIESVEEEPS